jgi:hypothetical protein
MFDYAPEGRGRQASGYDHAPWRAHATYASEKEGQRNKEKVNYFGVTRSGVIVGWAVCLFSK